MARTQRRTATVKKPIVSRRNALLLQQRLAEAREPDQVLDSLTGYLRTRWDFPPGEITPTEIEHKLSQVGVSSAISRKLAEIIDHCYAVRFGRGAVTHDLGSLAEEAVATLRAIESEPAKS